MLPISYPKILRIYFSEKELHNPVVVSPKDGGINRAKTFAKALTSNGYKNASFAAFIKEVGQMVGLSEFSWEMLKAATALSSTI